MIKEQIAAEWLEYGYSDTFISFILGREND